MRYHHSAFALNLKKDTMIIITEMEMHWLLCERRDWQLHINIDMYLII